ncbi:DUF4369 domain-containing protein [Urechidicola croceus]|uniref:Thiol:disulfide interchange protein n=1 Tax=Urechidicola croceus TaxID=1850246 RepID=A0A1D8PB84_9FLAO|nr:DUF4369 domain-containing protein [Urechidicola croceus]AOW21840.1 thiol:disulfide interchange protein [Urechidicola croceus]
MNKNIFIVALLVISLLSCSKKEGSMVVQGTIQGLQKGTLYLQKIQDTIITSVDSIKLVGESSFNLVDNIKEPELYFLTLSDKENEKINFFGEKGTITINSKLDKFATSAKITGSKSHDLLQTYQEMADKFNGRRLEIIKESFDAQNAKDDELIEKLDKEFDRLVKNRYRYTASFSIKNSHSEVAPYIALTELFDAHISLLDTVNNSLTNKIKASKYGKQLDEYIKEIKEKEVK